MLCILYTRMRFHHNNLFVLKIISKTYHASCLLCIIRQFIDQCGYYHGEIICRSANIARLPIPGLPDSDVSRGLFLTSSQE